ncbi:MAG: alpha/beta fold hydrolase, partial [Acetobacteraceae bacterium]
MSQTLSNFVHQHADLGDVRIHYVTAGSGFPVVLLHGWPQSWYEWRHVMADLSDTWRVIAPDLRGLGDSSRPLDGYDKKTVGDDIWRLLQRLGIDRFHLVGHDWGGPTAYAISAAHPEAVRRREILDVTIPGEGSPNNSQGGRRWQHAIHQT